MRYGLIMAGGVGSRLWPMSRRDRPKQLLPFLEGRSLIQLSAGRLEGLVPPDHRYVCAAERYRPAILAALPDLPPEQFLGEPEGRDTLNAVGFGAAVLAQRDSSAVFAVLTADHLIEPRDAFQRAMELGYRLVEDDPRRLVTFGIHPTHPATAYGYIEVGEEIPGFAPARRVSRFHEKPDQPTAERYIAGGGLWNSGMFIFSAAAVLDALEHFAPESAEGLRKIAEAWDSPQRDAVLREVYPTLPKISVDYALMEPASRENEGADALSVVVAPMEVQWRDVGSWPAYGETLAADEAGCRGNAGAAHLGSRNVLAVSDDPDHLIAVIGCDDLIVVRTADATLVMPAAEAERVKELVDDLPEDRR